MNNKQKILFEIENKILEVANLYNDLTTSDLQGVAMVKAQEILKLIGGDN